MTSSPRWISGIATNLAILAFAGATLGATKAAPAERLEARPGMCWPIADVVRWTPDLGPPARFVADTFQTHGNGLFIALGYTDDAFWSAESHESNDACDDCTELALVATSLKDGRRRTFRLNPPPSPPSPSGVVLPALTPQQEHAHVLGKLFRLANEGTWPAKDLRHAYSVRFPKRDENGVIQDYADWLVRVERPKTWALSFDLHAESYMCWCTWDWRARKVALPAITAPRTTKAR